MVSKSGTTVSAMVGTSGAICARFADPAASACRRPACTCGMMVDATTSDIDTRAASRSVTAGGLP